MIVFDWDGTVVENRSEPLAPEVQQLFGALLAHGVQLVVVSGTSLSKVNLPPLGPGLFFSAERGSQLWRSRLKDWALLDQQEMPMQEASRLDAFVQGYAARLELHGIACRVVSTRMNRRKLDLFPELEFGRELEKSKIPELRRELERRLAARGGIVGVISDLMSELRAQGLDQRFRVTTDFRNLEIGVTDKGDAAQRIRRHVQLPIGISSEEILILGDEFSGLQCRDGTFFSGSDARLLIPEWEAAAAVSLGVEPASLPASVFSWCPNGLRRSALFREILQLQVGLREGRNVALFERPFAPVADSSWLLEQEGFDPAQEGWMETLFSLQNGVAGFRSSSVLGIPTAEDELVLNGVYTQGTQGRAYAEPEMAGAPERDEPLFSQAVFRSPHQVHWHWNGKPLWTVVEQMISHERILDLRQGWLFELGSARLNSGELLEFRVQTFLSRSEPSLSGVAWWFRRTEGPRDQAAPRLSYESFDPRIHEALGREGGLQLEYRWEVENEGWNERGEFAARLLLSAAETGFQATGSQRWAEAALQSADDWKTFWMHRKADFPGCRDADELRARRFLGFQLRSVSPLRSGQSIGARGLTGRAYEGHIFWDAEIFILPALLELEPAGVRNALVYRKNTLAGARARAKRAGLRGASFAWESTASGEDATPKSIRINSGNQEIPIFTGIQQIHITADVSYALDQYVLQTGDQDFLWSVAVPIWVETARFWSSRVSMEQSTGAERSALAHLREVVGPDEYHPGVSDNAYTNHMAAWNMRRAARSLEELPTNKRSELIDLLRILGHEPDEWVTRATNLFQPQPHPQTGVIEQFSGYFDLDSRVVPVAERFHPPVSRLLNWREIARTQWIKQADVLMIPYLFPGVWTPEILRANFDYYEARTDHGSSLSPPVYAEIARQLGDQARLQIYLERSLHLDLRNLMGNSARGLHFGALGATWSLCRKLERGARA